MASWNGGSDSDERENDDFMKPSSSQMQLVPHAPEQLEPDSEENVQQETEDLFRNFVYQRIRNDNIQQTYDSSHIDPELVNLPRIPNSPAAEVGRQLARIGDDIYARHKDTFDSMIGSLNLSPDCDNAYEVFATIAKKIFSDGINWGRIVTLLCFGYRIAVKVMSNQLGKVANFLRIIIEMLLRFLVTEDIAAWIASHGGWRAALSFTPSVDTRTIAAIVSLAAVSVLAVIVWNRSPL